MLMNNIPTAAASSSDSVVFATIDAASYGDYDQKGNTQDILYNMSVYISNFVSSDAQNGYYLTILIGLQYPDGSQIWYQANLIAYAQSFGLNVYLYNAATQSGWYTAMSYSYSTYGHDSPYYSSLKFDPPSAGITGVPT